MASLTTKTELLADYATRAPVIPVVTIEHPAKAVPLARTLVEAGLPAVEITLRTGRALQAIEAIAAEVPEAVIAAGTVLSKEQIEAVTSAGAKFIVTPGTPPRLAERLAEAALPAMPGCATVSEALALAELGFDIVKFFPAGASGGAAWLKSVAGPLQKLRFCPTGGVDAGNAPGYLALPNVICVGGSWMVPLTAIDAGDWATIARLAREAAALRPA
jgi:2-dehydro-3-deoxyphosphogluconate aldolase/(4S)-4-hydroxy-2-oxoglutarate aldolase